MSISTVLQEIVNLLLGGLTSMAEGIGTGLGSLVESVFLKVGSAGTVEGLSVFGGLIIVFAGVSLAIGLSRWVVEWVTGLGK